VNAASRGGVWVRAASSNPAEARNGADWEARAGTTNRREGNDVTSWGPTSALDRARHGRSILAPTCVSTPDTLTVHLVVSTGLHASGCAFARPLFNREAQRRGRGGGKDTELRWAWEVAWRWLWQGGGESVAASCCRAGRGRGSRAGVSSIAPSRSKLAVALDDEALEAVCHSPAAGPQGPWGEKCPSGHVTWFQRTSSMRVPLRFAPVRSVWLKKE